MAAPPLKTLLIVPSVNPAPAGQRIGLGGTERMTLNLCREFSRENIEPQLLVFHDPGQASDVLRRQGVKVHVLAKRARFDPVLWWDLRRLIVREHIDAVLSMLQGTNLHNLLVTPTVRGVACLISYRGGVVYPWLARSEGRLARRAQFLITPAKSVAAEVVDKYRLPAERVLTIPNGCDPLLFPQRSPGDQQELRRQLEVPEDALVLYTPSRFESAKGQDIMAQALARIQPLLTERNVLWVCTGQRQDHALFEVVEQLTAPFKDRVRLLKPTDRPGDWYAACDLVVLPSRFEAFSNVLLEAAFSGRLFLASAVGETPEVVRNLGGGELFDGTAVQLADALAQLIQQPASDLLAAGAQLSGPANYHYSLAQSAALFARAIESAVRTRRGAPRS